HTRPIFLPDGRHFLYRATAPTAAGGAFYVGSLDSPERKLVFDDTTTGRVVYASGHLLYMQGATLVAQSFDANTFTIRGAPVPIAENVQTTAAGLPPVGVFSASDTGVLLYLTGRRAVGSQLAWVDRTGKTLATLAPRGDFRDVELSPDGSRA